MGGEVDLDEGIVFWNVDVLGGKIFRRQLEGAVFAGGGRVDVDDMAFEGFFFDVEGPVVGGDADVDCLDDLVIGEQFGRVVAWLIIDIGECIVLFIDADAAVAVPGLLDKKAVGGDLVDVVAEDNGVGEVVAGDFGGGELGFVEVGEGGGMGEFDGEEGKGGQQQGGGGQDAGTAIFWGRPTLGGRGSLSGGGSSGGGGSLGD